MAHQTYSITKHLTWTLVDWDIIKPEHYSKNRPRPQPPDGISFDSTCKTWECDIIRDQRPWSLILPRWTQISSRTHVSELMAHRDVRPSTHFRLERTQHETISKTLRMSIQAESRLLSCPTMAPRVQHIEVLIPARKSET